MRIQKGRFRGRLVESPPPSRQGKHQSFTPALLKGVVFDILQNRIGPDFSDWHFVDLCLGSGQMALEALSLGFGRVSGCELDSSRVSFLIQSAKKHGYGLRIYKKDFRRSAPLLLEDRRTAFFLDPPYSFWNKGDCPAIDTFFQALGRSLREARWNRVAETEGRQREAQAGLLQEKADPGQILGFIQGPACWHPAKEIQHCRITHRRHRGQYLTFLELEFYKGK